MVMGDRGNSGFGEHLGHGKTERNMHWNCENILGDKKLEIEAFDKLVDGCFQSRFDFMDAVGDVARSRCFLKEISLHINDGGMIEKGYRIKATDRFLLIDQTSHPETIRTLAVKEVPPFSSLQRY